MFSLTIQSLSHVLLGKQNSYDQDNTEETPYKITPQLCNAASSSPVSLTKEELRVTGLSDSELFKEIVSLLT